MSDRFEGKVALVTGAGSGMGAETAKLLASRGASVGLVGRRANKLDEVVTQIKGAGGEALAITGDVSRPEAVEQAVAMTVERFGALHYGVNNAGISGYLEPLVDITVEQWQHVLSINLSGLF